MKDILCISIIISWFSLNSFNQAQTWDKNYYDKQILYDNAELLQLTKYEKRNIKQAINNTNNQTHFYAFENNSYQIQENKKNKSYQNNDKESQKTFYNLDINRIQTKELTFQDIARQLNKQK